MRRCPKERRRRRWPPRLPNAAAAASPPPLLYPLCTTFCFLGELMQVCPVSQLRDFSHICICLYHCIIVQFIQKFSPSRLQVCSVKAVVSCFSFAPASHPVNVGAESKAPPLKSKDMGSACISCRHRRYRVWCRGRASACRAAPG